MFRTLLIGSMFCFIIGVVALQNLDFLFFGIGCFCLGMAFAISALQDKGVLK